MVGTQAPPLVLEARSSKLEALICPACQGKLNEVNPFGVQALPENVLCPACERIYERNVYGYLDFVVSEGIAQIDSTTEEYAREQESCGERVFDDYIRPFLDREPFRRVLDVGCGLGRGIVRLAEEGFEAYGLDLPNLSRFWAGAGNDPRCFIAGDSTSMPFPDGYFDVVYSLGVIEHIGTADGNSTLRENYRDWRQQYADEILRVTRPGGRILIACPNKSFPIDIQHGPQDDTSPRVSRTRIALFNKTGLNVHRTWGKYHLLAYSEVRRLFCAQGGASSFEPLPLKDYFGFGRFQSGFLKPIARLTEFYVHHLPRFLRATGFNPYMLVEIRRSTEALIS